MHPSWPEDPTSSPTGWAKPNPSDHLCPLLSVSPVTCLELSFLIFFIYCYYVYMGVCLLQHVYAGQRTALWGWFSPSTYTWVLGIELGLSGLHSKRFTHWSISLALPWAFNQSLTTLYLGSITTLRCSYQEILPRPKRKEDGGTLRPIWDLVSSRKFIEAKGKLSGC